jgi:hypothetical protein
MSAYRTTAPSSANAIPLSHQPPGKPPAKPEDKLTFAQARDAWLARWQEHDQLTHADRALVTQVYRHFNRVHFEKTGELLAWPAWKTIAARARLSKASVFRGFRKLERLGALEIKHGRYNHQTKRRAGNIYRAIDQGFILRPTKVSNRDRPRFQDETRLVDSDSLKNDSLILSSGSLATAPLTGALARPEEGRGYPMKENSNGLQPSEGQPLRAESPSPPMSARPPSEGSGLAAALRQLEEAGLVRRRGAGRDAEQRAGDLAVLERYRAAAAESSAQQAPRGAQSHVEIIEELSPTKAGARVFIKEVWPPALGPPGELEPRWRQ